MKNKTIFIFSILLLLWFFLPSTLFINDNDKLFARVSPDKEFTTVVYKTKIISPYSLYKFLKNEDYYFIIYGKDKCVVYKPSIFYGTSDIGAFDSIEYVYNEKHYLFFPSKNGYDSYELN